MMGFFRRLFGRSSSDPSPSQQHAPIQAKPEKKPPLPEEIASEFLDWYVAQRRPAIALVPDPSKPILDRGSRLFGPAWLPGGEVWPVDPDGVPYELIAQLDLAELGAVSPLPENGLLQFFIGRDDLYGADFDDLAKGRFIVRHITPGASGGLRAAPPLDSMDGNPSSAYSPSQDNETRARGIALVPEPFSDQIDLSNKEALDRFDAMPDDFDLDGLYARIDEIDAGRPLRHHLGGYPAFTQNDIRYMADFSDYDFTLLRLTSDDNMMWGDVGECVFMIRSEDLAKRDFAKVVYSWDCH